MERFFTTVLHEEVLSQQGEEAMAACRGPLRILETLLGLQRGGPGF
jgi:hypothetical protein